MTLLADLAAVSRRVADTPSRLEKIRELAGYLRGLAADEIPIAIAFLSGETRRGKLGVAYAALHGARNVAPQSAPSLTLDETDAALAAIAGTSGKGAGALRASHLAGLFALATGEEQDFLARLIVG